jgi:uncharacterized protein with HEPN domain
MQPSLTEFIRHIQDEIEFCITNTKNINFDDFQSNPILCRAVVRSLEIIGEASKKIPPDFKSKFPLIPWRDMSGMRDRLIHDYFGVDLEIVWTTINSDLHYLREWMIPLLNESKSNID